LTIRLSAAAAGQSLFEQPFPVVRIPDLGPDFPLHPARVPVR
jgi:hypothetical protein